MRLTAEMAEKAITEHLSRHGEFFNFFPTATCVSCDTDLGFLFVPGEPPKYGGSCLCGAMHEDTKVVTWHTIAEYFRMFPDKWTDLIGEPRNNDA